MLLPVVYLAGNGYLFVRVWQAMSGVPVWVRVIVALLFSLAAFSLFAALGLRDAQVPDMLMKCLSTIGSVWMGFLLYGLYFRAEPRLPQMVPLPHIRLKRTFPLGPSFPHRNP